ncbi:hypothetical protein N7495_008291 [Penicillium taxi]|uniref:uncharacterized protein n=1 Tax=Penicillium taxi TaxID=168475 RepID=UPI00254512BF|nr:uncharacterized protein N7495_008291 [Penicillium taxi]KAJ5888250.1 hypothetical protein N7495_008291 [Penicillium taxi]
MTETKITNPEFVAPLAQLFAYSLRSPILRTPDEESLEYEDISFSSLDGIVLEGWFIPARGSNKLIIANHPMPGNRYGYPGHLPEFAQFGGFECNFLKDYKALHDAGYNFLWSRPDTSYMELGLLSRCLGANASIIAMAHYPAHFTDIRAMIALQPVSARAFIETGAKAAGLDSRTVAVEFDNTIHRLTGFHLDELSPTPYAERVQTPTLVVQVREDSMTHPSDVQEIYDRISTDKKELFWIEGTTRRFDGYNFFGHGNSQTLAYIGENDIRYFVMIVACNKTNYKVFFPSLRNSDEAFIGLLAATKCHRLIYSVDQAKRATHVSEICRTPLVQIPSQQEMFQDAKHYPYSKTYEEMVDETSFIIHSSGTTGLPRPIPLTHGYLGVYDYLSTISFPSHRIPCFHYNLTSDDLVLSTAPFYHMMGIYPLLHAVFGGVPVAIAPSQPLSMGFLVSLMKIANPSAVIYPSSILEDLHSSREDLAQLSRMDYVWYGGAPLSPAVGQALSKVTNLCQFTGATEMGFIHSMMAEDKEDWVYFEWTPQFNVIMDPVFGDGEGILFELVVPRGPDRDAHGIFHTFPDLQIYRSNDLYTQHPTKSHLWKYYARYDDIVVLSNGEKFNPVGMEKVIEGHSLVYKAMITGKKRFQAALLVQPNWSLWDDRRKEISSSWNYVEAIWPSIEEANKGTLQRLNTERDYRVKIEAVYEQHAIISSLRFPEHPLFSSVKDFIAQEVASQLHRNEISETEDLYTAGLDSLQTILLANVIAELVRYYSPQQPVRIVPQTIYSNPTVNQLSESVMAILHGKNAAVTEPRADKLDRLVDAYTDGLQYHSPGEPSEENVVLLTGPTGSLGTCILNVLLGRADVTRVYCLNRSPDSRREQEMAFTKRGLTRLPVNDDKVKFLTISYGKEKLNLGESNYTELLNSVTTIIHNAWTLDFNQAVESFDPHYKGIRNLINLSLASRHRAHLYFVSSISTVGAWMPSEAQLSVPEMVCETSAAVMASGYAESKYIAERICLTASRIAGVSATVLRVGQIAGPAGAMKGELSRREWIPSIVLTSKMIGKLPNSLGTMVVDWIPVNTVAEIILELIDYRSLVSATESFACFNIVNPKSTSWHVLASPVRERYNLESVSLA